MGGRFFHFACRRLAGLFPVLLLGGYVWAAPSAAPHAKVTLISEHSSIQPGRPFWVGLHFQLEEHWHIYWRNPGDSGQPPRVRWSLPQGFRAGPIQWPVPRRLASSFLVDYGYEDAVLLMVRIAPSAAAPPGRTAKLAATVQWLVCSNICVPEKKTLALALRVESGPPKLDSRWRGLFAQTRRQLPRPMPSGWSGSARSAGDTFILTVKTTEPSEHALFFPFEPLQIKNAASQRVAVGPGQVRLTLEKSDELLKPLAILKGVLVIGDRKAITIRAPISFPEGSKKSF